MPVDLPESRAGALDQQAKPVQIALDASGTIFIDDAPVDRRGAAATTGGIAAEPGRPKAAASTCAPTAALDYGRVMRVMGELNRAGLNRVALVSVGR